MPTIVPAASTAPSERNGLAEFHQFVGVLRRGWHLVALSILVCLTLAIIYLARTKRMYQASTRVLVLQQGSRPLNVGGNDTSRITDYTEDLISTHAVVVTSPLVVGRAMKAVGMKNLPTLADADDPLKEAIRQLHVSRPDRMAKILQVDYRAGSREEAVRMVEAITASYQKFLEDSYQKHNNEVVTLITKARDELKGDLEHLEKDYVKFHQKSSVFTADEGGRSFITRRLDQFDAAVNQSVLRGIQLRTQLALSKKLASEGVSLFSLAYALGQVGADTTTLAALASGAGTSGPSDYVRQLMQEQQVLADRHGPEYSKVQQLHDQITRIQKRTRESRTHLDRAEIDELIRSIEHGLESVDTMRAEMQRRFEKDIDAAKEIEFDRLTEQNLRSNLERHRSMFQTVVEQLKQAQYVSDYSSVSAQIIEEANARKAPVYPRVSLTLALAVMVGFLVGSGAAAVADRLDQRIRSLEELRRTINYPVLGLVPQVRADQAASMGELGLIAHSMPRSPLAEVYRSIRTSLEFIRRNQGFQAILVTSAHPSDGKSTTASNLAISLALAGKRVLLIDGDLRKPWQHKVHGLAKDVGFTHVLRQLMPLGRVVKKTTVENLDLMTTGPEVPNPAELLTSAALGELLAEARQAYDIVIVDSSPLLAVTDAAIIGAGVDGVVLVTRPTSLRIHEAERIVELLENLGTPVLGTIINGLSREMTGYGYGYGYGTYGSTEKTPAAEALRVGSTPVDLVPQSHPAGSDPEANGHAASNGHVANGHPSPDRPDGPNLD